MTRPITGSQPTRSMKAKESAFARITSAATKAMSPITIKDCTVSNGIAAVFIEHMKLPIAVGQLQYSQHPVGNLAPSSTDQKLKPSIVARSTVNNTLPVAKKGFEIRADIFPMNVAKPVSTSRIPWPKLGDNIHSTPQLALCATLLLKEEEVDAHGAKDDNIRRE
ncbi:hypothetical protein FBU30_009283 [Linnemannia zychae]|nr:hypothetical protein FBU30_009283 [Linnemannia zychae]